MENVKNKHFSLILGNFEENYERKPWIYLRKCRAD